VKVLVLGTGLQGRAALYDLMHSPCVTHIIAADVNTHALEQWLARLPRDKIQVVQVDARDEPQVARLMQRVDAVIVLLPTTFHVAMARLAIANGIHLINSSYAPPEFQEIGRQAASRGLAILPEFGLDPGIDLVLAGHTIRQFDTVYQFYSYGAGFPEPSAANNPLRYKISWTFDGVLKAYRRDARIVRDGQIVDIPGREIFAPTNIHSVETEWGTLEAYPNGDVVPYLQALGILTTVRQAGRFALRYSGHCAFWYVMAQLGFLEETPQIAGLAPRDFVRLLLEPQLQFADDERDIALVRVDAQGIKDGRPRHLVYQVVDRRDVQTGLMAMNRTVGYTCSIGAQMILRGDIRKRGLLSPITDIPAEVFFNELRQRGITVQQAEYEITGQGPANAAKNETELQKPG